MYSWNTKIYLQALEEGLVKDIVEAGAVFSTPLWTLSWRTYGNTCKGERAIATTNRNFVGRIGSSESEVYPASPAVAAASALTGKIANPEEIVIRRTY